MSDNKKTVQKNNELNEIKIDFDNEVNLLLRACADTVETPEDPNEFYDILLSEYDNVVSGIKPIVYNKLQEAFELGYKYSKKP